MASKKFISGKNNSGRRMDKNLSVQTGEDASLELWNEVTNTVRRQPSLRISPVDLPALRAKKTVPSKKSGQTAKKTGHVQLQRIAGADSAKDKTGYVTSPANLAMPVHAGIDRRSAKKYNKAKWR